MGDLNETGTTTRAHEESPGVTSAKRISGLWMVGLGAAVLVALGIFSLFIKAADAGTSLQCGMALIITGASLLGVTVLEGVFKK